MDLQVLKEVVVPIEELVALREVALERFFVRMNGPDVSLQVLSAVEALAATLDLADVVPLVRLAGRVHGLSGRHAPASTLFGEVGNGGREERSGP